MKGRFIFISRPIELRISDVPLQQKRVKEKKGNGEVPLQQKREKEKKEGKWGGIHGDKKRASYNS